MPHFELRNFYVYVNVIVFFLYQSLSSLLTDINCQKGKKSLALGKLRCDVKILKSKVS